MIVAELTDAPAMEAKPPAQGGDFLYPSRPLSPAAAATFDFWTRLFEADRVSRPDA